MSRPNTYTAQEAKERIKQQHKESFLRNYEKNRHRIALANNRYQFKNRDKIAKYQKEYQKEYRRIHREEINRKARENRHENKQKSFEGRN